MVTVTSVAVKTLLTPSKIPGADYAINPYVGCTHGCLYCYAKYMRRVTHHTAPWGSFLDVKTCSVPLKPSRLFHKHVLLSSVTDPYNPFEKRYQCTRRILQQLVSCQAYVSILTKSALVLRDIDLLSQLPGCEVGFSFSSTDETLRRQLEPNTSTVEEKIRALQTLHQHRISTAVMAAPLLPYLSDWQNILTKTSPFTDVFRIDRLNLRTVSVPTMLGYIQKAHPSLLPLYKQIFIQGDNTYYDNLSKKIRTYCEQIHLRAEIFF